MREKDWAGEWKDRRDVRMIVLERQYNVLSTLLNTRAEMSSHKPR